MSSLRTCFGCKDPIVDGTVVTAKDKNFHVEHFNCQTCATSLAGIPYIERDEMFYCEKDYHAAFSPTCGACGLTLQGPYVQALDQCWHQECFVCTECKNVFTDTNTFRRHQDKPYCEEHYLSMFADKCHRCENPIQREVFEALGHKYHPQCFVCEVDSAPIGEGHSFHIHEGKVYCPEHFSTQFQRKCFKCTKPIQDQYIKINDQPYHVTCWKCDNCEKILQDGRYEILDGGVMCFDCSAKLAAFNLSQAASKLEINQPTESGVGQLLTSTPAFEAAKTDVAATTSNVLAAVKGINKGTNNIVQGSMAAITMNSQPSENSSPQPVNLDTFVSYDQLCLPAVLMPPNINLEKRESYLSPEEFSKIFKMTKDEFSQLKKWKQDQLKKANNLF